MSQNENNNLCFINNEFNEQTKKILRDEVCKDLPIEFNHNENYYCILHFPNNRKHENTNFCEVIDQRLGKQENNFCGVYFSDQTEYFFKHHFENKAIFERAFFKDAFFREAIFDQGAEFYLSNFERANFQGTQFNNRTSFIGSKFGVENYQYEEHLVTNFSGSSFFDINFQDCIFNKHPHFNDCNFEKAGFIRAKFLDGASFFSTKFNKKISFREATFNGTTDFANSLFDCDEKAKNFAGKKSFIINSDFENAYFQDVRFTSIVFEAISFQKVNFEKAQFWESTFNSLADFKSAVLKSSDFYKVNFLSNADFKEVRFQEDGGFFWSEFLDIVEFKRAIFEECCDILFNFTKFQQKVNFSESNISGYLSFKGNIDEEVFFTNTDLDLEYARIEKPEKVNFHTLMLQPYWFINIDSRKFNFVNIDWGKDFGKRKYIDEQINNTSKRGIKNSKELFKITSRQLADNAENNNRFEEASKFRRMAFETERIERKEKQNKWWNEELLCSEVFGIFLSKLKTAPFDFLHFLYRISSFYGESSIRAFAVLFGIISISALLYCVPWSQFPIPNSEKFRSLDFFESIFYSLRVMVLQRPEPFPSNTFGKAVLGLESVFAPLQLALLALAIRRKFMR